jgi:membrane protein
MDIPNQERTAPIRKRSLARVLLLELPLLLVGSLLVRPTLTGRANPVGAASKTGEPHHLKKEPWPGIFKATIRSIRQAIRQTDFGVIMRRSAALAYYAALSLAPLVIVAIGIASMIFDKSQLGATVVAEMQTLLGQEGAALFKGILESANKPGRTTVAMILGVATLLFGAAAVFVELQDGLNAIWNIQRPKKSGLWGFIRTRLLSVAMVVSVGFLLLVSLIVSTALTMLTTWLHLAEIAVIGFILHFVVSVVVTGLLFAALFKVLPDAKIRWREVIVGAGMTAILFNVGQIAIGQYLGRSSVGSAYGAAGSLVIVLVWVYYSAAILFFGAEATQAYAMLYGSGIQEREAVRKSPG